MSHLNCNSQNSVCYPIMNKCLKTNSNEPVESSFEKNTDEYQYLNLLKTVLDEYDETKEDFRKNRTDISTISLFGPQIEFDLRKGFPLLTTKRVFFKGVVEELLWFLRGQTSNKILNEKGVHIWDGNGSKEFMEKLGLEYPEGELGPVYGYSWRHFGGEYNPNNSDDRHSNEGGFDQIKYIINLLKNDPFSRRIILNGWNPCTLDKVALPPCHMMCQFYVSNKMELSCKLYLRSNDLFLGAPFNIASYSLLTHMLAHICNLKVGKLVYTIGDSHIYKNHIDQVKEQLERIPRQFPTIRIVDNPENIEDFSYESFVIENYNPYPTIKAKMAV
jgi:thymidylate synthase